MLMNLSFSRKLILQISIAFAGIIFIGNLVTSLILGRQLLFSPGTMTQESNIQQQNIEQAINILTQQGS